MGNEAEPTRLLRALILENHTVFYLAKISEVRLERAKLEVVRKAAHKDLSQLGIYLVTASQ